jgi:uncharacterized Zn-binding protein involved in type VI secretion
MPAAARQGDSCTGHACFPPRASIGGSGNVFINGIPAHRQGDGWKPHTCTDPRTPHGTHAGSLAGGSPSVFANGLPLGRVGDPVDCGSLVASGSPDVFAG